MRRIRFGILSALLALPACGKEDSGTPAVTVLTPEGGNHRSSQFSPDGGRVAYWAAGTDGWDLMVARADLSDPRKLVGGAPNEFGNPPLWSPDGSILAFVSSAANAADVGVVPSDGGEVRRLTDMPGLEIPIGWNPRGDRVIYIASAEGGTFRTSVVSLASGRSSPLVPETRPAFGHWSPDGSRIALDILDRGAETIWVADSAGGDAKQLTTEGQEGFIFAGSSPWSPDGSELVYTSRRTGTGDIWVLPVNGGKARQLTRDIRDDNSPVWSPDGKWVAFISTRGRQTDVWVVPAAGGTEIRVTDDAAEEGNVQWIGKSSKLAFHTGAEARGLWAMTVADGKERRITPDSIRVGDQDVSPDGTEVVYQVLRGGGVSELQVVPLAGGAPRTLVAGTADNADPYWSPDGKTILFESNRSGNQDVWVVDAAGGEPRQLTNWPTDESGASWAADGSAVYFVSSRDAAPLNDLWSVPATGGEPRRITTIGTVNWLIVSRTSPDVFVITFGTRAGQFVLSRLLPDGKLQTLWDKSNVFGGSSSFGLAAKGDSMAITAELPGGGFGSYLISTRTGEGRRILGKDESAGDFSRDGTQLVYTVGSPNQDLGLFTLKDGSTRRLTNTPENEGQYWWTSDGKTIVFTRSVERRRIATVDVAGLLARATP